MEWHEQGCPYVTKHYRTGSMQQLQRRWMDQGAEPTAHLLDTEGRVGRLYGALTALHMVVIDPSGRIVYAGAIDDKPTTLAEDLAGATNYVERALTDAQAGRSISPSSTEPYGCSIHYSATQGR